MSSDRDVSIPASPAPPAAATADRPQQFEALVRGFGRLVAHAVRRVAGAAAANDLADIEQDVMLALWKRVGAEQDIEHPASYVYKAAVREAVRTVARVRRRAEERLDDAPAMRVTIAPDIESRLLDQQRRAALAAALEGLAPDRARAVRAHLAGVSVAEMMQLYGWDYQRARNLVARGVADLKAALRSGGPS